MGSETRDPQPEGDVRDGPGADPPRDLAIDRFRGALLVLMVAGDFAAGVDAVPAALKHAPDVGLAVADLVAPGFVLAIALTAGPSFARRARMSLAGAYRHAGLRALALIGIGAILSAGGTAVAGQPSTWGVLQALGVASLLCLPVIRHGTVPRAVIGVLVMAGYQLALDAWWLPAVLGATHGGFFGAIGWGGLLILATAVADLRRRGRAPFAFAGAALAVAGLLAAFVVPVSKNRVSLSYVLIALAIAAFALLATDLVSGRAPARPGPLAWWGENPLALYLMHLLVLGLFLLPGVPTWTTTDAPLWLAILEVLVVLAALTVAARAMHRGSVRMRL